VRERERERERERGAAADPLPPALSLSPPHSERLSQQSEAANGVGGKQSEEPFFFRGWGGNDPDSVLFF